MCIEVCVSGYDISTELTIVRNKIILESQQKIIRGLGQIGIQDS